MTTLNTTGIEPTEFNVMVRLDRASEKKGSILLADDRVERDQALNIRGMLVAASPLAFTYDDWRNVPEELKPKVGDRVIIAKGSGHYFGQNDFGDGEFYRLLKDKDVCAIVREPVATTAKKAKAA